MFSPSAFCSGMKANNINLVNQFAVFPNIVRLTFCAFNFSVDKIFIALPKRLTSSASTGKKLGHYFAKRHSDDTLFKK